MVPPSEKRGSAREAAIERATLPLAEETVALCKERVTTGRVEVLTLTDTIEETLRTSLDRQSVEVTRVAIDREVPTAPAVRTDGDVTIVPVLEEVLVVEKRLVLREEIHIRRITAVETIETPVTLRRQRAVVKRQKAAGAPPTDDPRKETR